MFNYFEKASSCCFIYYINRDFLDFLKNRLCYDMLEKVTT